jgi:hypothetical protein
MLYHYEALHRVVEVSEGVPLNGKIEKEKDCRIFGNATSCCTAVFLFD